MTTDTPATITPQQFASLAAAVSRVLEAFGQIDERQTLSKEERPHYQGALRLAREALTEARYPRAVEGQS